MGGCVLFELCSVIEGLQVGVKANERNVIKPVIVCRILKNKEVTLTGASSCISMWLVLVRKETRRSFGFVGCGLKSGTVSVALFFESLLVDSMFDAPYFSGRLRRSSVPSEAAGEGMTSYLLLSAFVFKYPERTGLSRFSP